MPDFPVSFEDRYARNSESITSAEQQKLADAQVAVAGCGGLGGYAIEQLARVGIGNLICIDHDVFDASNLNRQLLCTEDSIGRSKAQVAAERVRSINSSVDVKPLELELCEESTAETICNCDCVLDCLDSPEARFHLSQSCLQAGVPIVFGAIAGWYGQVATVFPGDVIYSTIYGSSEHGDDAAQKSLGNLPFTCAATAAYQAAECVKVILGREAMRNSILMLDLLNGACERLP